MGQLAESMFIGKIFGREGPTGCEGTTKSFSDGRDDIFKFGCHGSDKETLIKVSAELTVLNPDIPHLSDLQ